VGAGGEPLTPLQQAVEDAYRVFCGPPPDDLGVCDCCGLGPHDIRRIRQVPVRDLDLDDIWKWYSSADANLSSEKVGYLLPRIFDFLAQGKCVCAIGNQIALRRIGATVYPHGWTSKEQQAVEGFLAAFLDALLVDPDTFNEQTLDEFLCMAASANADIPGLLRLLDAAEDGYVARALSVATEGLGTIDCFGGLVDPFWSDTPLALQDAVRGWYCRPELCSRVEQAFFAETEPEWQRRISNAAEVMRTWWCDPDVHG